MNDPLTEAAAKGAIDLAQHFLGEISKAPMSAIGGLLADRVNYWRFCNRINLLLKAREFLESREIKPEQILPDIIVPLLEDGSNTEDPTLASMFAGLLASHLDAATKNESHPSYTKILAQLSPLDAQMIADLHGTLQELSAPFGKKGISLEMATAHFGVSDAVVLLSFQNLWRLGICDHGDDALARLNQAKQIFFTDYGWSFACACLQNVR